MHFREIKMHPNIFVYLYPFDKMLECIHDLYKHRSLIMHQHSLLFIAKLGIESKPQSYQI